MQLDKRPPILFVSSVLSSTRVQNATSAGLPLKLAPSDDVTAERLAALARRGVGALRSDLCHIDDERPLCRLT